MASVVNTMLKMTCKWRALKSDVLKPSRSDKDFEEPVTLKCWIADDSKTFKQGADGFTKVTGKTYIFGADSQVKEGDMLDGVFVMKVTKTYTYAGVLDHLEVFAAKA